MAATLAFWVVWDCVVQVAKFGKPTIVVKQAFPVYRGTTTFLPILLWEGWGAERSLQCLPVLQEMGVSACLSVVCLSFMWGCSGGWAIVAALVLGPT